MIVTRLQMWAAVAVAAALAGLLLWQWGVATSLRGDLAEERSARAAERTRQGAAALIAMEKARADERTIANTITEALRDERQKTDTLASDLVASAGAADRLRRTVAALAARSRERPASATAGPASAPTQAPGDVLADMLLRMDAAGRELASYADRARIAGQLCERHADAVTTP